MVLDILFLISPLQTTFKLIGLVYKQMSHMAINYVKLGCINNAIMTVVYPAYNFIHDNAIEWKHIPHNGPSCGESTSH